MKQVEILEYAVKGAWATAYLGYAELINEIEKMERFLAVEEDEEERAYYNARLEELTIEAWARGIEI